MAKKGSNPFVNMTLEEVADAEARLYFIQVGDEVVEFQGKYTFNKHKTDYLFDELFTNLRHMFKNGTKEEKEIAGLGLLHFHVYPLRIH